MEIYFLSKKEIIIHKNKDYKFQLIGTFQNNIANHITEKGH